MTNYIIKNRAKLELAEGFIERVMEEANLPSGNLIIVLHDRKLVENSYGQCIPRRTLPYAPASSKVFSPYIEEDWECGIALSNEACDHYKNFPAFFTYLLGHELGHAYICLLDINLHIFCCLIKDFYNDVAGKTITQCYEFPHEKCFDQFGIHIAARLYSHKKLLNEIRELLKDPNREDHNWLETMLTLPDEKRLDDLKQIMINFVKPYKNKLIEEWQKDVEERGKRALASEIDNYEALFC